MDVRRRQHGGWISKRGIVRRSNRRGFNYQREHPNQKLEIYYIY